ncbi:hypothetical protein [Elizabethkingia anophelis]|uniref:hypothetical protein n=1 Tax=Elizabethkingia anophelis TaxID=1117645 RepID=UPI00162AB77A|nr:hypothetical protein [Elizabethkingia anophelis]MCT3642296.1 hypothetical protein [Elizabethkingia anophelis]
MKRLEEITRKWSVKFFFSEKIPVELTDEFQKEIELYAREVAQASLQKAAENALIDGSEFSRCGCEIDEQSIVNLDNIVLL